MHILLCLNYWNREGFWSLVSYGGNDNFCARCVKGKQKHSEDGNCNAVEAGRRANNKTGNAFAVIKQLSY